MTIHSLITAIALIGVLGASLPVDVQAARIKCWTNDEGVRECGNAVPPKYAQKGHKTLNRQGVTVGYQKRAKSKAELAEEARKAQDEADRLAEETRVARIQEAKDRVLLDTFTSEEELLLAHRGRQAALASRINHAKQVLAGLNDDLTGLQQEAANQERSGGSVPKRLAEDIASVEKQIKQNYVFIAEREEEQIELDAQFGKDVARYRELKNRAN